MSKIACVYCGQSFELNSSLASQPVKCPHCGSDNTVAVNRARKLQVPQIRPAAEREPADSAIAPVANRIVDNIEKVIVGKHNEIILTVSATCGVPNFVDLDGCIHDGWQHFKNLKHISKHYLFHVLKDISEHLAHIADGSVQKHLNIALVGGQMILVPDEKKLKAFDDAVVPMFERILRNGRESRTLAALRDALLPKLLSGEVRVGTSKNSKMMAR